MSSLTVVNVKEYSGCLAWIILTSGLLNENGMYPIASILAECNI